MDAYDGDEGLEVEYAMEDQQDAQIMGLGSSAGKFKILIINCVFFLTNLRVFKDRCLIFRMNYLSVYLRTLALWTEFVLPRCGQIVCTSIPSISLLTFTANSKSPIGI